VGVLSDKFWIDVFSMPLPSFILVYVREMAGSFNGGYYFLSFLFTFSSFVFSCCFTTVYFWSSYMLYIFLLFCGAAWSVAGY
jgi:hypothetical protein